MCGRFVASAPASEIADLLDVSDISYLASNGADPFAGGASGEAEAAPASWNVAPTDDVWGVTAKRTDDGDLVRRLRRYQWGLIPSWSKSPTGGARSINPRAESVFEKPMFRLALERRRCIIPADAFYEWRRDPPAPGSRRRKAEPWCFRPAGGGLLAFAGLWEFWRERPAQRGADAADLPFVVTCTIITTDANAAVAPIHDRMPVVLPPATWAEWLAEGALPESLLDKLFVPAPDDSLVAYRVAPLVNDVRQDGPALVVPYDEGTAGPAAAAPAGDAGRLFELSDLG